MLSIKTILLLCCQMHNGCETKTWDKCFCIYEGRLYSTNLTFKPLLPEDQLQWDICAHIMECAAKCSSKLQCHPGHYLLIYCVCMVFFFAYIGPRELWNLSDLLKVTLWWWLEPRPRGSSFGSFYQFGHHSSNIWFLIHASYVLLNATQNFLL